jgi:tetrahydromethanopterin S-methyltransferase subunit A
MVSIDANILKTRNELETAIQLSKCQKCGCMRETLDNLSSVLPAIGTQVALNIHHDVTRWMAQLQATKYACLGCEHCYPAVAHNLFAAAFPNVGHSALGCEIQIDDQNWPPVVGEYFVLSQSAPVAVSTLASVDLAEKLASHKPTGLAIVGKTETENIGIDKIIKNMITNPSLHYLIVCGRDSKGHQTGKTLLALAQNGIDAKGRVIESPGKQPFLRNVNMAEINQFREQVQVVDMVGCRDIGEIGSKVASLSATTEPACGCGSCNEETIPEISSVKTIFAAENDEVIKLDKAGYFVIMPTTSKGIIIVEYYGYDNRLQGIIEGKTARAIYITIVNNGWVTELSHAAYLGKELTKAEMSLSRGFKYIQEGA